MKRALILGLSCGLGILLAPASRAQEAPPAAAPAAPETPAPPAAGTAAPATDTVAKPPDAAAPGALRTKLQPLLTADETPSVFFLDQMVVDKLDTEERPDIEVSDLTPPRLVVKAAPLGKPVRIIVRGRDIPIGPAEAGSAERCLRRARNYAGNNDFSKALIEARDGLALDPNNVQLLSLAAVLATSLHDYERARAFFQRYNELVPHDAFHLAGQATVLIRLSRLSEAESILNAAGKRFSDNVPMRYCRACLDILQEKRTLDADYWRKRSTEDMLSVQRWLTGDRNELIRIMGIEEFRRLTEAILGTGTAEHMDELGARLKEALERRQNDDHAGAIPLYEQAIALGCRAFGPRVDLADSRLVTGDVAGGSAEWKSLEADFGDWPQYWLSYGQVLYRYGNYALAASALERGATLSPPDRDTLNFVLACAYAMSGQQEKAKPLFNDLALRRPGDMRNWLDSDPTFEPALKKMVNYPAYMRALGIAPSGEL